MSATLSKLRTSWIGRALLAYAVMLLGYDWRLALLCLVFAPCSSRW